MQRHEMKAGPGGGAPEPRCIAQQANAVPEYPQSRHNGNTIRPGAERTLVVPAARQRQSALEWPVSAFAGKWCADPAARAFRDSVGRKWRYRGKRAGPGYDSFEYNQGKSNGGGYVG